MSTLERIEELVAQWGELLEQGQYVPAEDLCATCPELLDEVERRISELNQSGEEAATASGITGMMTVMESDEDNDGQRGALRLPQHYSKLRFHARGGLGEIYIADDGELQRDVVLKFIRPKHRDRKLCRDQFQMEAEVTARLDHPGVVPVYGFGETPDGRLCYAMRFIKGESLDQRIAKLHASRTQAIGAKTEPAGLFEKERAVEFRSLMTRFVTVCQTIAYAHNRGILHRDIKPDNVMLGKYGDTLVVDWGLAMAIDRDDTARASGEQTLMPGSGSGNSSGGSTGGPVGTPAFMSPEQAEGVTNLAPASDIYALGATLYKLLTGRAPFMGDSARETLTKARYGSFDPPRTVNDDIPVALESVCLKAMALQPQDRYFTALELADDLERWLADEPVQAREENWRERFSRHSRRHMGWILSAVGALLIISLVVSGAAITQQQAAQRERAAHLTAHTAHVESLQLSAQFIARTVGRDLQLRWLILQKAATEPELVQMIRRLNAANTPQAEEGDPQLQLWLSNHRAATSEDGGPARSTSWFVNLRDGRQAGRTPWASSLGTFFGYRDYFHGKGQDLDPETIRQEPLPPITTPYRSIVFRSRSNGQWMVALSVPVWAEVENPVAGGPRREVIGILAMSQSLGDFEVLNARMGGGRVVLLVDTGASALGDRGTVLHDSRTGSDEWMDQQGQSLSDQTRSVPESVLKELIELRGVRRLQHEQLSGSQPLTARGSILKEHTDYLGTEGQWIAASEPIIFRRARDVREDAHSSGLIEDTGWIVVVQESVGE